MSSTKSTPNLKHGEEPTELLLALASSPIETLCQRKLAYILTAEDSDGHPLVLAVFKDATWTEGAIVLASVGNVGKKVANAIPVAESPENIAVTENNGTSTP